MEATVMSNKRVYLGAVLMSGLLIAGFPVSASALNLAPATVFAQAGVGDQKTTAYVAGVTWDLPWHYDFRVGRVGAYVEAALGRWHTDGWHGDSLDTWPTQISAVPNVRFYPGHQHAWFFELGAGPSYIVPLFNTGRKRFSTEFNFDDHLAIGRSFGHVEVSLRGEHFSNAGISRSNPGEDFGQLRIAYRF
jgi:lipid A 3-O-deacylase